jgi:small-conductance mechanosensitive channel
VALILNHAIKFLIDRYRRKKIESNAAAVTTLSSIGFVLKTLLWFILLLVVLDNYGVNVTALVAGLGISGIAVALAVQNVLGDLFASFSIVFDKPFVIGDFIIVGDFMGTVEYVGLKTTRVRSLSGEQLIFSNTDLLKSLIRNFKRMFERRVVFTIGVLYQTSYEKLIEIPEMIQSIIESHSQARFDRAHFKEYGAYSLNFEIVYWIQDPDYNVYMDIQQAINLSIFRQFKEKGIQFAYPTQTLLIEKDFSAVVDFPAAKTKVGAEGSTV